MRGKKIWKKKKVSPFHQSSHSWIDFQPKFQIGVEERERERESRCVIKHVKPFSCLC